MDDNNQTNQPTDLQTQESLPKEIDEYDLLNTKIELLENEKNDLDNKYKRAIAERINIERQSDAQKAFLTSKLLEQLIDIKDDLEVILSQIPPEENETLGNMGTNMAHGKLSIMLMTNGVMEITANVGDDFNPSIHEALTTEENTEMKGKITQLIRKGYILKERVLRPARVIVGK